MSAGHEAPSVRCSIRLEFESPDHAEKVHRAVELDNEGYVESRLDGDAITAEIDADSLNSLLHTLDDFIACVSVAHKIVTKQG